jgi:hypothetical protein
MIAQRILLPARENNRDTKDSLSIGDNVTRQKVINTRR